MSPRPRNDRETKAGFTLLEALVATALMGLILATLVTITAQWLPNWNRGLVNAQRGEQIALGLDRLSADLEAAQFVPINGETHSPFFDGGNRSVTFVRTVLGPNRLPGLDFIRIAEIVGEQGPVLVRSRAPFVPNGSVQPNFTDPVVLLRAPYQLSFSYAGADRVWRHTWQQQIQLPTSIKMIVRDTATQQTLPISTAIRVHVELPATCVSAKSYSECLKLQQSPEATTSAIRQ